MHLVCLFHDKAWCCADCHKCLLNERMRGRKEKRKCKYMNDMVCFGGRPFYRRMKKECYSKASLEIQLVHLTVSCKHSNRGYHGRRKGGMHSYWLLQCCIACLSNIPKSQCNHHIGQYGFPNSACFSQYYMRHT